MVLVNAGTGARKRESSVDNLLTSTTTTTTTTSLVRSSALSIMVDGTVFEIASIDAIAHVATAT